MHYQLIGCWSNHMLSIPHGKRNTIFCHIFQIEMDRRRLLTVIALHIFIVLCDAKSMFKIRWVRACMHILYLLSHSFSSYLPVLASEPLSTYQSASLLPGSVDQSSPISCCLPDSLNVLVCLPASLLSCLPISSCCLPVFYPVCLLVCYSLCQSSFPRCYLSTSF